MTTLSAEVAYDSALTQQLLKKPRTLGDYMEIEKQLRAAAAEIERLHARVRELMADAVFAASTKKHHGVLMEENERLRAELLRARAEIESWKQQSRANWEAARELTTHALKP